MSELSNAIGSAGPKHIITFGDKTYTIGLINQRVKLAFEKHLFHKTRDTLAQIKAISDKDYYERKVDALMERYEQGGFDMHSEFGKKAMASMGGALLLMSLLMGTQDPADKNSIIPLPEMELMGLVSQKPEEMIGLFKLVIKESFPGVDVDKLGKDVEQAATNQVVEGQAPKA